jgi:hypothetical protein
VNLKLLVPGVQYAKEADLSPKMPGIASDLKKCFCTGAEQQIIDSFFVL